MSDNCDENTLIREREGTTQQSRYKDILNPVNVELMGFGVAQWMQFAKEFAKHVNFFDGVDDVNPSANWENIFDLESSVQGIIENYDQGEISPQLGLFICFLRLLDYSKTRLNGLTQKHLDFYYKQVLQLKKKKEQADSVYVLFELAKNASKQLIEEGTILDGGKDENGNTRNYVVTEELVVNKAKIAALKNTYLDNDNRWLMSDVANSGDGLGSELETENGSWLPFGDTNRTIAKKGFTLASPSLKLTEGNREISLNFEFKNSFKNTHIPDFERFFKVEHTSEKAWVDVSSKLQVEIVGEQQLVVTITLEETDEGLTPYDVAVHEGEYNSEYPLLRILFETDTEEANLFYQDLVENTIKELVLSTTGSYKENLTVKNDFGIINLDNPFYPFGFMAKKNANLKIGSEEWIGKNIIAVALTIDWKDLPENLETHYEHYVGEVKNDQTSSELPRLPRLNAPLLEMDQRALKSTNKQNTQKLVTGKYGDNRFNVLLTNMADSGDETNVPEQLFKDPIKLTFYKFLKSGSYLPRTIDEYFIKLSLTNSFLQEVYTNLYTQNAIQNKPLPNAPYAPYAEGLQVEIKTKESFSKTKSEIAVYHEHPFGITTLHNSNEITLVPKPDDMGQLFIGLEQTNSGQQIQLLVQLEEGSEDHDSVDTHGQATLEWCYLYNNIWHKLKPEFLLKDTTDNFLKTGLVQFVVPKSHGNSTLFKEQYLWLRASINKPYNTVCRCIGIHTQALMGEFANKDNELSHLKNQLPVETISKLEKRIATIKKIEQPYASFNGAPAENDIDFYKRISERLRHKNRAISVWDYEHIVLQKFNYLHKVKCLNHSTENCFKNAGEVLLIAIPNIINLHVYDVFKPKLSQAKLNEISLCVNQLNSMHVNAKAISPSYEEVRVEVAVKFGENKDPNFYQKQLEQDIAQFLAPWAFDKSQKISFANTLFGSEVIYFIEHLPYVDFIKNFSMFHNNTFKNEITPNNQKSILTSVKPAEHKITPLTTSSC